MEYAVASASLAHTYGNVACFITEFIKSLFPKNYFRTVHISSSIAYRQFNIFENSRNEFLKKGKPMLIIKPRIEINDSDTFLYGTFLTTRITDNVDEADFGNLQEFIRDEKNGIYIKFLMNRLKMFFDVSIIVETQMEQINRANYLKNRIRQDRPFILNTSLESYIPKELITVLSKDCGVPLNDPVNGVKPIIDYLNTNSVYPVTYKMKNSSGNDEFFRYYPVGIDTSFTGLSMDDGSKKGFISDAFTTTFTVSTEFNTAGLYYYFTQTPDIIPEIDLSMITETDRLLPIFTVSNIYDVQLPDGWVLYSSPMYKVDSDKYPDSMDIRSLFNNSLLKTIEYHLKNGIPVNTFLNIRVMKDNVPLDAQLNDFSIDYSTLTLTTNKVNLTSTYRLFIYVNNLYINNLLKNIYDIDDEK